MRNVKFAILILSFFLKVAQSDAQLPGWSWVNKSSDTGVSTSLALAVDDFGNTYITGYFSGEIHLMDSTFRSRGGEDIIIAKYSSSGDFVWAKQAGGIKNDEARAITVDASNNIYITGFFTDTAWFDGMSVSSVDSNLPLRGDIFIAKYNSNGNLLWTRQAGGKYVDKGYAIHADKAHNSIYISGFFSSNAPNYAPAQFDTLKLIPIRNTGTFLTKYDTNGKAIWAKSIGGILGGSGNGISTDRTGNILLTGNFDQPYAMFDTIRVDRTMNISYGEMFLTKFDSSGHTLWAKGAGGTRVTGGSAVSSDSLGNTYVTGTMSSPSTRFDNVTLPGSSDVDNAFLAKYSPTGQLQWARSICSDPYDYSGGSSLVVDAAGNSYACGYFSYYCSVKPGDSIRSYTSASDVYVAKIDPNGNGVWATHGGPGRGNGIAMAANGDLYTTGFVGNIRAERFGAHVLPLSNGGADMFVGKLSLSTPPYVGVSQAAQQPPSLRVYPNPSNGTLRLEDAQGFTDIQITDQLGRPVWSRHYSQPQNTTTIDLPHAATGLYYLNAAGKGGMQRQKILIRP